MVAFGFPFADPPQCRRLGHALTPRSAPFTDSSRSRGTDAVQHSINTNAP
jgi:hypothetical protein